MPGLSFLQVRNPKDDETPIESATQIFASLLPYPYVPLWKRLFVKPKTYAFEFYLVGQTISLYVACPVQSEPFISSLISSSFPHSVIIKTDDPLKSVLAAKYLTFGEVALNSSYYYPIKTYQDFRDIDTMSSLIGFLSKQDSDVTMAVQILISPATVNWQEKIAQATKRLVLDETAEKYSQNPQRILMQKKAAFQGGKAVVRLVVGSNTAGVAEHHLRNLAGTFGSFSQGEGNQFVFKKPLFRKKQFLKRLQEREMGYFERRYQILNAQELATIWHPPGLLIAGVKNLAWGKTLSGEPPENLPISQDMAEEVKKDVNFFAKTEFRNQETIFGIKGIDRRKHAYIIGKTGSGKSTLIANMAIDDIRKDRGVGIIDPHGDLSETILNYIPRRRLNDVVYLEPFDLDRVFALNVLEVKNQEQRDLVTSGIVAIFYKLYRDSWGPRLEYILRNVIMTLLEVEGATLVDVLRLLTDTEWRSRVVDRLQDVVLKNFWIHEFDRMPEKLRLEAVSPIQNKVGQFVSSRMIRNIIGASKSTIDLQQIMDEGKILILNLSQGKLGEDNASLLGAMVITQMQLAVMNRSFVSEEERRDFFLYVDEFQNFATSSFIKILSEARKYRLCLTLANQYIGQLEEDIEKAIFGNVGTLISFVVGASDAELLSGEFGEIYSENDLVSLGKYEIVLKLSIDGLSSAPFPARTLPLPAVKNENKTDIIRLSKERYGRKVSSR